MRIVRRTLTALAFLTASGAALAQEAAQPPAPAAATSIRIPAGTIVQVELTEALSSQTSQQGQLFGLRLAEPILVDGREIVAAGALGGGEVIDAHPRAFGGRQGRLILSGRFVEIGGQRVRVRGMQMTAAGSDRANASLWAGGFVQGGAVEIPIGARGTAILAADVDVPIEASTAATSNSAPPVEQAAAGENQ
jgi:hypothetical protein